MSLERDYFDDVLKYIEQMLMEEEDIQNHKARMFHEGSALQVAEKSFYDVLVEKFPGGDFLLDDSIGTSSSQCSNSSNVVIDNFVESSSIYYRGESESVLDQSFQPNSLPFATSTNFSNVIPFVHSVISSVTPLSVLGLSSQHQLVRQEKTSQLLFNDNNVSPSLVPDEDSKLSQKVSKGRKNASQEDTKDSFQEERSNKQLASYSEEAKQSEMYYKVLLCPALNPGLHSDNSACHSRDFLTKESKAGRPRSKRRGKTREFIDLRSFLTQCAQASATGDSQSANKIVKCIRQHSPPYGDGTERLVHYFSNAIEARLDGTGMALYTAFTKRRISAVNILKAYQAYLTAGPFQRMSNIFANKSIYKLARGAKRLHIIDFGILHGFQWPCIIQGISLGTGEPLKLRLTGIDPPQPGFRPAERVEEMGRHLAQYCKRFNVPFEYNAIAKKWDVIQLKDLKIEKDEKLVVNCLYRLRNVLDETVVENGPRNKVLNLIKNINPDLFVHGVLNGSYNSPFFITRFREALFHFSSLFDRLEATALREDKSRLLFEQEVFARDVMNVIACEGTARIERPETYKQWKFRNMKAGFRQLPLQLPLHKDLMKEVSAKVRLHYHKDFLVDEESKWMIQGWKGRVLIVGACELLPPFIYP